MGLWSPTDECITDDHGKRHGPSGLATLFIVLFGLHTVGLVIASVVVGSIGSLLQARQTLPLVLALGIEVLGYVVYFRHYRRCQPWMGWLLFLGAGVLSGYALSLILGSAAADVTPLPPLVAPPPPVPTETEPSLDASLASGATVGDAVLRKMGADPSTLATLSEDLWYASPELEGIHLVNVVAYVLKTVLDMQPTLVNRTGIRTRILVQQLADSSQSTGPRVTLGFLGIRLVDTTLVVRPADAAGVRFEWQLGATLRADERFYLFLAEDGGAPPRLALRPSVDRNRVDIISLLGNNRVTGAYAWSAYKWTWSTVIV